METRSTLMQPDIADQMPTARRPRLWIAVLLTGMAAGMGWGIRGQYGHGTGAMIAGVLCGLTLVMLFWPRISSLAGARAAALFTIAISFGGTMTYGQTVGLTHDAPLVGNWYALGWGMLGLALKGRHLDRIRGLVFGHGHQRGALIDLENSHCSCGREFSCFFWVSIFSINHMTQKAGCYRVCISVMTGAGSRKVNSSRDAKSGAVFS